MDWRGFRLAKKIVKEKVVQQLAMNFLKDVNWDKVLGQSDLLMQLIANPKTAIFMQAAMEMRDPVANALFKLGRITEEEAAPTKEGGLGLLPLLKRATEVGEVEED